MASIRQRFPHLIMDFTPSPSVKMVAHKGEALTEVWGDTPELIVLDTAKKMRRRDDSYGAWMDLWITSSEMARYFNCVVMYAHHIKTGAARHGNYPPQQGDGKYGADEEPEIVIGLHNSAPKEVTLSILKNRTGRNQLCVPLTTEYEYSRIVEKGQG